MKKIYITLLSVLIAISGLVGCDRQETTTTANITVPSSTTNSTTLTSAASTSWTSSNTYISSTTSVTTINTTALAPRIENLAIRPGTTAGSITISISALDNDSMIYYVITTYDALTPTISEILSGEDYRGMEVLEKGEATYRVYRTIEGFDESVRYMAHIVLKRAGEYSEVISRRVMTKNQFEAGTYGTGTYEDPYQIHSVWQLELIATDEYGYTADSHYVLVDDIDLAEGGYGPDGNSWVPIGKQNGLNRKFSGIFDGAGHTISNLWIEANQGTEKWGLFQETAIDSVIKNLHLTNVNVRVNGFRIAALVGYSKGHINNVSVTNAHIEQTAGEGQVGAIVGAFYDTGVLYKASSDAVVIATGRRVGGLVGAATTNAGFNTVWIAEVEFTGSVTGIEATSRQYGGILGAGTGVQVSRAYVNAEISGVRQIGGIVGYMEGSGAIVGSVKDCVYDGDGISANGIDGNTTVGIGLILGDASITKGPYEVMNCYSANTASIDTVGSPSSKQTSGTSVEPEQLTLLSFYQAFLPTWIFVNTWTFNANDDPSIILYHSLEGQS
ncbi:MAG: hypothetical protein JXR38_04400 [Bacilli bacterium]|nr:hypothetical protein [Bacilli bacterium]